jgi:16S rRNA G527 N7-methylase RsmG
MKGFGRVESAPEHTRTSGSADLITIRALISLSTELEYIMTTAIIIRIMTSVIIS